MFPWDEAGYYAMGTGFSLMLLKQGEIGQDPEGDCFRE
jgi:hypothetical protein